MFLLFLRMVNRALDEQPSTGRLYLRALLAVSLLGTVVNVVLAFWKR